MSRSTVDRLLLWGLRACALIAGGIVVLIALFIVARAAPGLRAIGLPRFFIDPAWRPAELAADGQFNLVPMLAGTLAAAFGAVLLAAPLGLLSAMFCRDYAPPRLAMLYRRMLELLAGIPSVVYGFWGLVVLVPLIRRLHPPGPSLLAGVLILALMILPTIALLADAAIAGVPAHYRRGAAALGLSRWTALRGVILPAAGPGIVTGVILATGRAIGETMAILMVCGNIVQVPGSLFDPIRTLTASIALEMGYALGDHQSALFVTGLMLLVMVGVLVAAAEVLSRGRPYG